LCLGAPVGVEGELVEHLCARPPGERQQQGRREAERQRSTPLETPCAAHSPSALARTSSFMAMISRKAIADNSRASPEKIQFSHTGRISRSERKSVGKAAASSLASAASCSARGM